jgi:hypothetical protein
MKRLLVLGISLCGIILAGFLFSPEKVSAQHGYPGECFDEGVIWPDDNKCAGTAANPTCWYNWCKDARLEPGDL